MAETIAAPQKAAPVRPILVDENDGPCEICAAHIAQVCDRCGKKVDPRDREMGSNGYQSVRPSHFHLLQVSGIPGRKGFHQELCYDCHRADRLAIYGDGYGERTPNNID